MAGPKAPPGAGSLWKVAPESEVVRRATHSLGPHGANPSNHQCAVLTAVKESGAKPAGTAVPGGSVGRGPGGEVVVATAVVEVELPDVDETPLEHAARASAATARSVRRETCFGNLMAHPRTP